MNSLANSMLKGNAAIRRHLRDLQDEVQVLELDLARKQREIIALTNSVAPISLLPSELIAEIFNTGRHTSSIRPSFPLVVSHVTRKWREIAIQSPSLWTDIRIGGRSETQALLDLYLQRSQDQPLDVEIHHFHRSALRRDEIRKLYDDIFGILAHHAGRWRHLRIIVDSELPEEDHLLWIFTQLHDLYAPRLQSFYLESNGIASAPKRCDIFTHGAPLLSSIVLRGDALPFGLPPLSSVTKLELGPCTDQYRHYELNKILTGLPTLSELVLRHHLHFQAGHAHLPLPIELPSLISLDIQFTHDNRLEFGLQRTLDVIEAPNLESFTLDIAYSSELSKYISGPTDKSMSDRFPRLSTFGLHLDKIPDEMFPRLCDAFPDVTQIITTRDDTSGLLSFLDGTERQILWPKLDSLTIIMQQSYKSIFDKLCSVISSRVERGHPIRHLKMPWSFTSNVPIGRIRWLQKHVELEHQRN
jgi:hypothetical protein